MKAEQIKKFLAALGRPQTRKQDQWIQAPCPFGPWYHKGGRDSNPSFGIKVNAAGRSHYNCFSCARGGSLDDLWVELLHITKMKGNPENLDLPTAAKVMEDSVGTYIPTDTPDAEYEQKNRYDLSDPWPAWWVESFQPADKVERAREYLLSRGLSVAEINHFNVRYDSTKDAVVFPVFNARNWLVGARGRYLSPKGEVRFHDYDWQGKNSTAYVWYNENAVPITQDTVVITEGVIDAIRVWRHYRHVLSPFSVGVSVSKLKYLSTNFTRVVVFADNDAGGQQMVEKVLKYVASADTKVQSVTYPPGTEGLDPGKLTDPQIRAMLNKLKLFLVPEKIPA